MGQNSESIGNSRGLKSVLVARFSALGDVAMTVPVLYSACICHPDVKFVMVTRKSMSSLFVNPPANLEVVGVDVKKDYTGIAGIRRLVNELHSKYTFDAFVDLHDVLRTKLMRFFCRTKGIRVSMINKGRAGKRALTRKYNKVMLPLNSSRARYREAFFRVGLPTDMVFKGLYGRGGKGDESLFASIAGTKPAGIKWIALAPFAAHPGKVYPIEKMDEVVRMLAERDDVRIFVFGAGDNEHAVAAKWQQQYGAKVTSMVDKKAGFPVELSLLSHMDVMLTMDSANMHLASIAGARTVSIWGATHPYCGFRGWHQIDSDMVQLPLQCRPCSVFGEKKCFRGDLLCLSAIRPETVYEKICEVIDK